VNDYHIECLKIKWRLYDCYIECLNINLCFYDCYIESLNIDLRLTLNELIVYVQTIDSNEPKCTRSGEMVVDDKQTSLARVTQMRTTLHLRS
jgi:hypothetical protein